MVVRIQCKHASLLTAFTVKKETSGETGHRFLEGVVQNGHFFRLSVASHARTVTLNFTRVLSFG